MPQPSPETTPNVYKQLTYTLAPQEVVRAFFNFNYIRVLDLDRGNTEAKLLIKLSASNDFEEWLGAGVGYKSTILHDYYEIKNDAPAGADDMVVTIAFAEGSIEDDRANISGKLTISTDSDDPLDIKADYNNPIHVVAGINNGISLPIRTQSNDTISVVNNGNQGVGIRNQNNNDGSQKGLMVENMPGNKLKVEGTHSGGSIGVSNPADDALYIRNAADEFGGTLNIIDVVDKNRVFNPPNNGLNSFALGIFSSPPATQSAINIISYMNNYITARIPANAKFKLLKLFLNTNGRQHGIITKGIDLCFSNNNDPNGETGIFNNLRKDNWVIDGKIFNYAVLFPELQLYAVNAEDDTTTALTLIMWGSFVVL